MIKIEYTYEIINVDKESKSMEIIYRSKKYGTLHVGARLPWEGESIESIVRMYNPSQFWLENNQKTIEVEDHCTGKQVVEVLESTDIVNENIIKLASIEQEEKEKFVKFAKELGLLE